MARLADRCRDLTTSLMKDGIYDAAVSVLTQHGVEGMTMERVAEQAGIAKGSVYNYFPSKLELLQFVHERTLEPIEQMVQEEMAAGLPAVRTIASCIRKWFEYLDQHRGLFGFLFQDYAVRGLLKNEEEAGRAKAVRDLTTIIERGIEEGDFRRVNATRAARLLFGAVRETAEQHLATSEALSMDELTEGLLDIFFHGVEAEK